MERLSLLTASKASRDPCRRLRRASSRRRTSDRLPTMAPARGNDSGRRRPGILADRVTTWWRYLHPGESRGTSRPEIANHRTVVRGWDGLNRPIPPVGPGGQPLRLPWAAPRRPPGGRSEPLGAHPGAGEPPRREASRPAPQPMRRRWSASTWSTISCSEPSGAGCRSKRMEDGRTRGQQPGRRGRLRAALPYPQAPCDSPHGSLERL
jgi:hypothetical protein